MNQHNNEFTYEDKKNIDVAVTLTTGETYKGLRCSLLRTYSLQWKQSKRCDAEALIFYDRINGFCVNARRIEPFSYDRLTAPDGRVWKVESYKETVPPEAPGLIFCLLSI